MLDLSADFDAVDQVTLLKDLFALGIDDIVLVVQNLSNEQDIQGMCQLHSV